jgi:hypothetical protein
MLPLLAFLLCALLFLSERPRVRLSPLGSRFQVEA